MPESIGMGLFETVSGRVNPPGPLLFVQETGSTAYNLAVAGSDVDYLGVYVAPTRTILGLGEPPGTLTNPEGTKPDCTVHEVGKFCRLLLKGNPTIVESLFVERNFGARGLWGALRAHRRAFLTRTAVEQYLGYCQGQLLRIEKGRSLARGDGGRPDVKWAYHMLRLALDVERIVRGEEPVVWRTGDEREQLMGVRRGETPLAAVVADVKWRIAAVNAKKPWPLPDEGDRAFLNDWLLFVRETAGR